MYISQEVIFPEDDRWTTAAPKQVLPRPVFDWPKVPSVCEDISIGPPALTITQASAPRVPVARLTFVGMNILIFSLNAWTTDWAQEPVSKFGPVTEEYGHRAGSLRSFRIVLMGSGPRTSCLHLGGWDNTVTGGRNICDRSIATGPGLANTSHTLEIYVDLVRDQVTGLYIYNATVDIPKYPDPLPQAPQLPVISSFPAAPSSGDDTPDPPDSHIPATTRVLPPRPDTATSDLPTPTTDGDTSSAIIRQSATAGVAVGRTQSAALYVILPVIAMCLAVITLFFLWRRGRRQRLRDRRRDTTRPYGIVFPPAAGESSPVRRGSKWRSVYGKIDALHAPLRRGDGISYQDVPLIDIHSPLPSEEQDIAVDFMSAELGLGFSTDTVGPSLRYVPYRDEVEDDESEPPMYSD